MRQNLNLILMPYESNDHICLLFSSLSILFWTTLPLTDCVHDTLAWKVPWIWQDNSWCPLTLWFTLFWRLSLYLRMAASLSSFSSPFKITSSDRPSLTIPPDKTTSTQVLPVRLFSFSNLTALRNTRNYFSCIFFFIVCLHPTPHPSRT